VELVIIAIISAIIGTIIVNFVSKKPKHKH